MSRPTVSAPAASSVDAHAPPVAPVVSTSSTSTTAPGCLVGREHPPHRLATRGRASARLRSRVADPPQERKGRRTDPGCHRSRERSRLVVPAGREPVSGERDPGDRARRPGHVGPRLDHRARERVRDGSPSAELQPVDRAADRPVEPERRARDRDRVGRAIAARDRGARSRRAASLAPRRRQDDELGTARSRRTATAPSRIPRTASGTTHRAARPPPPGRYRGPPTRGRGDLRQGDVDGRLRPLAASLQLHAQGLVGAHERVRRRLAASRLRRRARGRAAAAAVRRRTA